MAGVGFEIKRLLNRDSYFSLIKAYSISGVISSGPWVISIFSVILIAYLSLKLGVSYDVIIIFVTTVNYMVAFSLIISGFFQLMFTRFVADRLYENRSDTVWPNLVGCLIFISSMSGLFILSILLTLFDESFVFEALVFFNFILLSNLWIVLVLVASLKAYIKIIHLFAIAYSVAIIASVALSRFGTNGMLIGILFGHSILLFGLILLILEQYSVKIRCSFDFLNRKNIFIILIAIGFLFNLSVWVDKLIFWFHPHTSQAIIGPLRGSIVYDVPIFIAYLSIVPGMAVFLLRMEADFSEAFNHFQSLVKHGGTFAEISSAKQVMIYSAQQGIYEIFKVQGIVILLIFIFGESILTGFGLSASYANLLNINVIGVAMQVLVLSILNILFYLDAKKEALTVTLIFLTLNASLSILSIMASTDQFLGYGFTLSTTLTSIAGLYSLSKVFDDLEYRIYMLQ